MNGHVLTIGPFSPIALSFLVLRCIFFSSFKNLVFGLGILISDFSAWLDFDFVLDFNFFWKIWMVILYFGLQFLVVTFIIHIMKNIIDKNIYFENNKILNTVIKTHIKLI